VNLLWAQPFHVDYNTKIVGVPAHEWPKKGDNYDCSVTFVVLATAMLTAGFASSLGAEHRENLARNWTLTGAYIAVMLFLVGLIIGGPTNLHCIFRVNCDNHVSRTMYVPFVQEVSCGNVGGCFLGPQLQAWKEELGDRWQFPDEKENMCFPADGFDPEQKLRAPSEALFGLGNAMCLGPNNCFSGKFRVILATLVLAQSGLSILCHKMLLQWHPGSRKHFKTL